MNKYFPKNKYKEPTGTWKSNQHQQSSITKIKITMRYHLIPVRTVIIKMSKDNKYWQWCREKGTPIHCWWEYKLVQPLWKTVMESPQKLKIDLSYDPTNLLLSIHQKENNHYLQEISALPCSLQHYSKEPQYRNNFSVCRWMDEENAILHTHTHTLSLPPRNTIQP